MDSRPLADVKDHLSEYVDQVAREHARVTITRNGRPAAVLVSPEDLGSLEETLSVLGDRKEISALREGIDDLNAGRVVTLSALKEDLGRA
jgi:antitoxin YefM